MLRYRLISSTVMIIVLAGVLYLDQRLGQVAIESSFLQSLLLGHKALPPGLLMLLLLAVLLMLAVREMSVIFAAKGFSVNPWIAGVFATGLCLVVYLVPDNIHPFRAIAAIGSLIIGAVMVSAIYHCRTGRTQGAVAAMGVTVLCVVYLGLGAGFLMMIRRWQSPWVVAGIFLVIKSCDIGAYFTGRAIGKHKLIPWLSPGKTWEGFVGGVLTSAGICVALVAAANSTELFQTAKQSLQALNHPSIPFWQAALAGAAMGIIGQLGDLTMSLFKRDAGLKDSGHAVPGFGGVLDVVDSPILVAPLAYWLFVWVGMVQ